MVRTAFPSVRADTRAPGPRVPRVLFETAGSGAILYQVGRAKSPKGYQSEGTMMIEGVRVKQLKPIADERGRLMEILRADDETFQKFGQAYLTTA